MADKGGKSDMERVGLFQEMAYVTIGDKYRSTARDAFNEAAGKGRQMLPGGLKEKSAQQHGYFTDKFSRVFEGESYSDPIKLRRLYRLEQSKKNLSKPFLPSSGEKMMCGLGNHFGTFTGPISSFSPVGREGKGGKSPGKNILTNPGKKGTGYGYISVTLGKYPPNQSDPFNADKDRASKEMENHKKALKGGAFRLNMHPTEFFDGNPYRMDKPLPPVRSKSSKGVPKDLKPFKPSSPGKLSGGAKIGTFDPYPSHSADLYEVKFKRIINVVNKSGKTFVPPMGPKTRPVNSIVDQNVLRSMNIQNYRAMTVA